MKTYLDLTGLCRPNFKKEAIGCFSKQWPYKSKILTGNKSNTAGRKSMDLKRKRLLENT